MTEQKQRPVFLLVLCILSFIGIAFAMFGELYQALLPEFILKSAYQSQEMMDSLSESNGIFAFFKSFSGSTVALAEHARTLGLIGLLLSACSLVGVILMFKLKKTGWYFYSASNLLLVFTPVIIAGSGAVAGISLGINLFFTLLFILLYALNLKSMS